MKWFNNLNGDTQFGITCLFIGGLFLSAFTGMTFFFFKISEGREKSRLQTALNENPSSGPFIFESAQEIDGKVVRMVRDRVSGERFVISYDPANGEQRISGLGEK